MTNNYFKYKLEYTIDGVTNTSYHKNTESIKDKFGIPRSSLFLIINPDKITPDKFRHYKCFRIREPIYEKTVRTILD